MKNFQTSISQIYQKILFPYFYHKYLSIHAIRWHKRHGADWRGNSPKIGLFFSLLKTIQFEWFFPIFSQNSYFSWKLQLNTFLKHYLSSKLDKNWVLEELSKLCKNRILINCIKSFYFACIPYNFESSLQNSIFIQFWR